LLKGKIDKLRTKATNPHWYTLLLEPKLAGVHCPSAEQLKQICGANCFWLPLFVNRMFLYSSFEENHRWQIVQFLVQKSSNLYTEYEGSSYGWALERLLDRLRISSD